MDKDKEKKLREDNEKKLRIKYLPNIKKLLRFNQELKDYIKESHSIRRAMGFIVESPFDDEDDDYEKLKSDEDDAYEKLKSAETLMFERHEAGLWINETRTMKPFKDIKGTFMSLKNFWTYIHRKRYLIISRTYNDKIRNILRKPISDIEFKAYTNKETGGFVSNIQAWDHILETLKKIKEEIWKDTSTISIVGTGFWGKSFLTIRSAFINTLGGYIKQLTRNINQAKANRSNAYAREQAAVSAINRFKQAQALRAAKAALRAKEAERRYKIQLRETQQEKMREIAAERKRVEEENRSREEANRQLEEKIRRKKENKKALQGILTKMKVVKRIRNTPKCKKYEKDVNMYKKALERQEEYIAGNCNRKGCNDDDIDNLDIYKKKIKESKKTQQTAIDNDQCPRTVKLKF